LDTGISGFLAGHNRRIEVHEEASTYTANAGNAHIYGGEFEIQALVTQELVVSLNTGYTYAALVSPNLLDSNFNPGTPLQYDQKWTAAASLVNRHPLTDQYALTAHADTTCMGSRRDATYAINTLPSYQLTNIHGGLKGRNGPQFCS
jgi:outer membrane receptor protein involved in Fe transport